jgi:hypothetical protein
MPRHIAVAGSLLAVSLAVLLPITPTFAITAKQKMATCEFGADHPEGGGPKLVGAKRKQFVTRCMSNKNDPRGTAVGTPGSSSAAGEPPDEPEPK